MTRSSGSGAKPRDQPSSMNISIGPERGIGEGERSPKPEYWDLSKNGRSTEVVDSLIFLSEARVDDKNDAS